MDQSLCTANISIEVKRSKCADELDHIQKRTISNHLKDKGYFKINTIKAMNRFAPLITTVLTRRLPDYTESAPEERSRCEEYESMCLKLERPFNLNSARFIAAFAALTVRVDKLQADLDEIKKIFENSELQFLHQNPSVQTEVFFSHYRSRESLWKRAPDNM